MRIELYDETRKNSWDEFVRGSKNGTFLFQRNYMDYHKERFSDHSLLIRDDKDKLLALLPANQAAGRLVSHGGLTYGGFIIGAEMKAPLLLELFDETLSYLQARNFTSFVYKTVPYIYHKVAAEEDRYALFLSNARIVRRGLLTIVNKDQRIPFQERRQRGVKRALKNKLVVRPGQGRDFEAYWELLSANLMQTYQTRPVHSLPEITRLHSCFPQNIKLFGCYQAENLVAGVVIYESDRVAHVQYIAASDLGKELSALDLLFDYLLHTVYSEKPFFDFSTSDEKNGYYLNRGLIEQKEGFGARMMVHDHYEISLGEWRPGQIKRAMEEDRSTTVS